MEVLLVIVVVVGFLSVGFSLSAMGSCLARSVESLSLISIIIQSAIRDSQTKPDTLPLPFQESLAPHLVEICEHLVGLREALDQQRTFEIEMLKRLADEKFICHYCSHTFGVDSLERISNYDYCPQHGLKRQALLNREEAA